MQKQRIWKDGDDDPEAVVVKITVLAAYNKNFQFAKWDDVWRR